MKTSDDKRSSGESAAAAVSRFFVSLLRGIFRDLLLLVAVFVVATAVSALACAWYDIPLVFSLAGGILAMALTSGFILMVRSESWFFD
jgi:hypothetical protein